MNCYDYSNFPVEYLFTHYLHPLVVIIVQLSMIIDSLRNHEIQFEFRVTVFFVVSFINLLEMDNLNIEEVSLLHNHQRLGSYRFDFEIAFIIL